MTKKRMQTLLAVGVLAVGGLVAVILGVLAFVMFTARPLHPNADEVPSETHAAPSREWADAVSEAQRIVRADLVEQNLPGLSVAVGADGGLVWAEGFGFANLETRTRVEPDTRFRIGGTSMALTSAAVGLLLERDRLKLDDEIQKYVSAFPAKQWPVTLRHLMGHVAGIRGDEGDEEPLSQRCEKTVDGLKRFADAALRFEPGTQFRYSTYGWILVSAAVEAAADEPFNTFMRTEIFQPLDMDDTKPDVASDPNPGRAKFYFPTMAADNRYGPQDAREGDYSCFAGAGGFLSTPSDLVRFALAVSSGKLLQPATVKLLQTPQRLASGEESGYALGWDIEPATLAGAQTRSVGHDGEFAIGGSTSLLTFPERGLVVAVTTNTSFADVAAIALKVAEAFAKKGQSPAGK
jgi:serine beta-lactamase-like protein LACTB, mitochondrial